MKHIVKAQEPEEFISWKEHNREEIERKTREGNMDAVFNLIKNPPNPETDVDDDAPYYKNQLREELLQEQGYICCYCTRSISNSYTTKIDHFLPKEIEPFRHLVFAYENLLACCDGGERGKEKPREVYCDTKKGGKNPISPFRLISPFDQNCETYFEFDEMGEIHAAQRGNSLAVRTIDFYGLDARALNLLRRKAITEYILNMPEGTDPNVEISLLKQKIKGKFQPFCTAIISVLSNYT